MPEQTLQRLEKSILRQNHRFHMAIIVGIALLGGILIWLGLRMNIVIDDVRDNESPAATEAREKSVESIISEVEIRIDCSTRRTVDEVINGLEESGLLNPGQVDVQRTCAQQEIDEDAG